MNTFHLRTTYKKILADVITPVSVYLKIRDVFPQSLLLESSDYHSNNNNFSYICCNPIADFTVKDHNIKMVYPNKEKINLPIQAVTEAFQMFISKFHVEKHPLPFITNGLFGYTSYDAVQYLEDITLVKKNNSSDIPEMYYAFYQNIIAINHFKNEAYVFCHSYNQSDNLEQLLRLIKSKPYTSHHFKTASSIISNQTDESYLKQVTLAKKHCVGGDVFQLVLSRRFSQEFTGDDFNVYRSLRSINPSPYLFYFDYGNFKLFGSSPEAQLIVKENIGEIHPIAGTFKRTGNDKQDQKLAKQLVEDEKENAEHVMLVDLARNDLSRHCKNVVIQTYKEVQFFSHVIHLVSKVIGEVKPHTPILQLVADTFPAGTLSGAPKHKAMQLIERYEPTQRTYYGGAIGFLDFQGNYNHAIMIRTFLSQNHTLHWQAGAGIVSQSKEENELQEVYNKLRALNKAIILAEEI